MSPRSVSMRIPLYTKPERILSVIVSLQEIRDLSSPVDPPPSIHASSFSEIPITAYELGCRSVLLGERSMGHPKPNLGDLWMWQDFWLALLNGSHDVSRTASGETLAVNLLSPSALWTLPTIKHYGSPRNRKKYINWDLIVLKGYRCPNII